MSWLLQEGGWGESRTVVKVGDGERQGIRGVVLGLLLQMQQHLHHPLDLFLLGVAVSGDRQLDLSRLILVNRDRVAQKMPSIATAEGV